MVKPVIVVSFTIFSSSEMVHMTKLSFMVKILNLGNRWLVDTIVKNCPRFSERLWKTIYYYKAFFIFSDFSLYPEDFLTRCKRDCVKRDLCLSLFVFKLLLWAFSMQTVPLSDVEHHVFRV